MMNPVEKLAETLTLLESVAFFAYCHDSPRRKAIDEFIKRARADMLASNPDV